MGVVPAGGVHVNIPVGLAAAIAGARLMREARDDTQGRHAGVGLVLPTLAAAAMASLPAERFATGTAIFQMSRQLGRALFVAVLGSPGPDTALEAFQGGWILILVGSLGAAAGALCIGRAGAAVRPGALAAAGAEA